MRTTTWSVLLVVCLAAAAVTAEAQPRILNGSVTKRVATGSLASELTRLAGTRGVTWVAYSVPAAPGQHDACCYSDGHRPSCCHLERDARDVHISGSQDHKPVPLEYSPDLAVFLRFEQGQFSRAAVFSLSCEIDASGKPVTWLTGVKPADSVAWLAARIETSAHESRRKDDTVMALALHGIPEADTVLNRLASTAGVGRARESVVFWMGAARGAAGYTALQRLMAGQTDEKFREKIVFAISISKEPGSVDSLIRLAKEDRQAGVRGQALFWLAQKAGERATSAITSAVENDPDTEVRRRAVFALSQLPKDEGVPKLIGLAKSNRHPEVRKQAMFWLGQSKDPRALAFFEMILTGRQK